jgi:hypothetical protein
MPGMTFLSFLKNRPCGWTKDEREKCTSHSIPEQGDVIKVAKKILESEEHLNRSALLCGVIGVKDF